MHLKCTKFHHKLTVRFHASSIKSLFYRQHISCACKLLNSTRTSTKAAFTNTQLLYQVAVLQYNNRLFYQAKYKYYLFCEI